MTDATGLFPALHAVQAEVTPLQASEINPHFGNKFVPLNKIHEAVMPLLHKHGLAWVTLPGVTANGNPILRYRLIHVETGDEIKGAMPLLPTKADPQGQGSAITYARRYSLMAVLGLVADEDDDGNEGSKHKSSSSTDPVDLHDKASFADRVAALPGTTELATKAQLTKLAKAKDVLGVTRFDAYLRAQGVDSAEELTKDAAESVLTWARDQAKKKAA